MQNFHHQKQCLAHSLFCQVNFCPLQSHRRRRSSRIFKGFWLAAPRSKHATTPRQHQPPFQRISCYLGLFWSAVQPPLSPLYDGPFLVLERLLHFFKVQIGSRAETISTHRLKPCHTPEDAQPAEPPRRGRPPTAAAKPVVRHKLSGSRQPKRVSFADPVATSMPPPPRRPPTAPPDRAARLRRSTARPARYTA
jgi:hypothetical protein